MSSLSFLSSLHRFSKDSDVYPLSLFLPHLQSTFDRIYKVNLCPQMESKELLLSLFIYRVEKIKDSTIFVLDDSLSSKSYRKDMSSST